MKIFNIFKPIISPIQHKLLEQGMCVACTRVLNAQKKREPLTLRSDVIICECGRAYIFDRDRQKYRRALNAEVKSVPAYS